MPLFNARDGLESKPEVSVGQISRPLYPQKADIATEIIEVSQGPEGDVQSNHLDRIITRRDVGIIGAALRSALISRDSACSRDWEKFT